MMAARWSRLLKRLVSVMARLVIGFGWNGLNAVRVLV